MPYRGCANPSPNSQDGTSHQVEWSGSVARVACRSTRSTFHDGSTQRVGRCSRLHRSIATTPLRRPADGVRLFVQLDAGDYESLAKLRSDKTSAPGYQYLFHNRILLHDRCRAAEQQQSTATGAFPRELGSIFRSQTRAFEEIVALQIPDASNQASETLRAMNASAYRSCARHSIPLSRAKPRKVSASNQCLER